MFRRLERRKSGGGPAVIRFEGREIAALEGENLAAALLAAGETTFRRTPVSGALRGPFCMMGVCYDCLVQVDGMPGQQACMTLVRNGMEVRRDGIEEAAE